MLHSFACFIVLLTFGLIYSCCVVAGRCSRCEEETQDYPRPSGGFSTLLLLMTLLSLAGCSGIQSSVNNASANITAAEAKTQATVQTDLGALQANFANATNYLNGEIGTLQGELQNTINNETIQFAAELGNVTAEISNVTAQADSGANLTEAEVNNVTATLANLTDEVQAINASLSLVSVGANYTMAPSGFVSR